MGMMTMRRRIVAAVMAVGLGVTLAACGDDDSGSSDGSSGSGGSGGEGGTVTLGIIPSWTDGVSMAYLWKNVLEEKGYTVEIEEVADAAPLYTGVANGDVDVYPSAWPEVTHKKYMEQYGDELETLGDYYDGAVLTLAVPEYTEIDSIDELADNADMFDGRIVGIEPGAGLTGVTKDSAMPEYGLDEDFELVTGSTPAMLAELKKAVDAKEDIVVTLWRPFWANNKFPVKDLEDPKGAMGEPEPLSEVATAGFSDEFPEVAEMMGNAKLDDEQYGTLEDLVVNKYGEGKEPKAVEEWLKNNPDWVKSLEG